MVDQYNYDRFLLGIFTNRRIPYQAWIGIFFVLTFFIPEIIFHEILFGVSWINAFYMTNELIAVFPEWYATPYPHVDWLNISYLIGAFTTLILSKGLYERACDLKKDIMEQYNEKSEDEKEKVEKEINHTLKLCFKTIPKVLIIIVVILLPFLFYYTLIYEKFLINPEKTILLSIEAIFKMEFIIAILAYLFATTLSFGLYTRKVSDKVIKVNVFHPDRVGGLKGFGNATLQNVVIWTVISSLGAIITMLNVFTSYSLTYYLFNLVFFSALIIVSVFIFLLPIYHVHKTIKTQKRKKLRELSKRFEEVYDRFSKVGDYGNKSLEYSEILYRLDAMTWQTHYVDVKNMRDWPWDTNIIARFYFSLLIPVIVAILSVFVLMPF